MKDCKYFGPLRSIWRDQRFSDNWKDHLKTFSYVTFQTMQAIFKVNEWCKGFYLTLSFFFNVINWNQQKISSNRLQDLISALQAATIIIMGSRKRFWKQICCQFGDLLLCSVVMWQATTLVLNDVYDLNFKWHKLCVKYCLSVICDKISLFFLLSWQIKFFIPVDYFMSSDGQVVSEKSDLGAQNLFKSYLTEWNCLIVN